MFHSKKLDIYLILPVLALLIISIAVIGSVSGENVVSQAVFLGIALGTFFIFSYIDIDIYFPLSPLFYIISLFLLILPYIVGNVTRGSVRWIPLGKFNLQPSEIIKPFFVLYSAWFWTKKSMNIRNLMIYSAAFLPCFLLIFFQPDLGSALVLSSIFVGMILFNNIPKKILFPAILAFLLLLPGFWLILKDYQKNRVINLFDPYKDPFGQGYNVIQAIIAIGSGGCFGRGLGKGTQSHLAFLPERHTDFIFSSLGEELGFIGISIVLLSYLLLFLRILKITSHNKNRGYFLISLGIFIYIFFQTVVNIGMNLGIIPITGITLPFLSYGGSSLLTCMISLGILESIYRQQQERKMWIIGG